jgi:hypothetical protein
LHRTDSDRDQKGFWEVRGSGLTPRINSTYSGNARLDLKRWVYLDVLAVLLDLMVINEMTGGLYAYDDLHVSLMPEGAAITGPQ